jgi:hypothetical protein
MGRDDWEPGLTVSDVAVPHAPYVRHVVLSGHRDQYGQWVADTVDEDAWELICRECGDDEGLADSQSEAIRSLRGPYPHKRKAEDAERQHDKKFGATPLWTPGSTVPQQP